MFIIDWLEQIRTLLIGVIFGFVVMGAGMIGAWLAARKGDNNDG